MNLTKQREDVRAYILSQLEDEARCLSDESKYCSFEGCELANQWLNTDYFIIGTHKAKQWLGSELFEAVGTIQEYELDNFGESYTDLTDPERVANMLSYILGNELLSGSVALAIRWNSRVSKYTLEILKEELECKK